MYYADKRMIPMQVTETLNEGLKRAYSIVVPAAELDAKVNDKLIEAQPEVEMKGFRKGKVPMALLKKQYGPRVMGEAMQEAIDGAMAKHFDDSGDRPAMQPEVKMTNENWKEGDDVAVDMSYEALPAIPDVDFTEIELEKLVVKADDAAIDEALSSLAETAQNFKDRRKGSKAKDGDQVVMDFLGKVDGDAFDGGAAEDYPLVLGSNSFIPGFEEQLVGVKAGEVKDVVLSFPDDYQAKNLAGKKANFETTINEIKEDVDVKIDDDFAKTLGMEDLNALKKAVSEQMSKQHDQASREKSKRQILDKLAETVSFELPETLEKEEYNSICKAMNPNAKPDLGHNHAEHDHDDNEPDADKGMSKDEKLDASEIAKRRVRLGLLLSEIGRKNNIKVEEEDTRNAMMKEIQKYPGQEKQVMDYFKNNPDAQQQLSGPIFEDKIIDFIMELASTKEKTVTVDDLYKQEELDLKKEAAKAKKSNKLVTDKVSKKTTTKVKKTDKK